MEIQILNELLTTTVSELFPTAIQNMMKHQITQDRMNSSLSNSLLNLESESSSRSSSVDRASSGSTQRSTLTREQWLKRQAPRMLKESIRRIGINQSILNMNRRDIQRSLQSLPSDRLAIEKKNVKNQLRIYDNAFLNSFGRNPEHLEKEPLRPLYIYYKRLKDQLSKRGEENISPQEIHNRINAIREHRRVLRERIEAYSKQFQETNNRRIRFARDIRPIEQQYRKYKDLKLQLLRYQELLGS